MSDKVYYPEISEDFQIDRPFEISFELSKTTHTLVQSVYKITDLLIDIGGISRAMYTIGLFLAHFAAMHLYKAALVKDLFMVQDASKNNFYKKPINLNKTTDEGH